METNYSNVADNIYLLMKKMGLTYEQFGNLINVSGQTVLKWAEQASYPTSKHIVDICYIFELEPNFLFAEPVEKIERKRRKDYGKKHKTC